VQHLGNAKQALLANVAKMAVKELEGGRRSGDGEYMLWASSRDVLDVELHEEKPIVRSCPEDGLASLSVAEQAAGAVNDGLPFLTDESGDGEKILGKVGNIKYIMDGEEDVLAIDHVLVHRSPCPQM
jgi:hypothetical protein